VSAYFWTAKIQAVARRRPVSRPRSKTLTFCPTYRTSDAPQSIRETAGRTQRGRVDVLTDRFERALNSGKVAGVWRPYPFRTARREVSAFAHSRRRRKSAAAVTLVSEDVYNTLLPWRWSEVWAGAGSFHRLTSRKPQFTRQRLS
jgi:hypothetical protein